MDFLGIQEEFFLDIKDVYGRYEISSRSSSSSNSNNNNIVDDETIRNTDLSHY